MILALLTQKGGVGKTTPATHIPGALFGGEPVRLGGAAGLAVKLLEVELPAAGLVPAVFAHQAVEPALDAAGEVEIVRVDGENQSSVRTPA